MSSFYPVYQILAKQSSIYVEPQTVNRENDRADLPLMRIWTYSFSASGPLKVRLWP